MSQLAVLDKKGVKAESLDLPESFLAKRINTDVIHQAIVKYQASNRQGNASTKERADVSGGGRKPHRQKGTGQARAGSSRSPLRHGGGVTFGPHPRDFGYTIPKKIRTAALLESLKAKYRDGDLVCILEFKDSFKKTKEFVQFLNGLSLQGKVLAALDGCDESVYRVSKNIPLFNMQRAQDLNAYDILRNKKLLLTKAAFESLVQRATKCETAGEGAQA